MAALLTGGGYAQFAIARPEMTARIPPGADLPMMAALPAQGLTAYLIMRASTVLNPGESVLIHGAGGGVGNLAAHYRAMIVEGVA